MARNIWQTLANPKISLEKGGLYFIYIWILERAYEQVMNLNWSLLDTTLKTLLIALILGLLNYTKHKWPIKKVIKSLIP